MGYCRSCLYVRTFFTSSDPNYYTCVSPKLGVDPRNGKIYETYCTEIREGKVPDLPQVNGKCTGYVKAKNLRDHFYDFKNYLTKLVKEIL